MTRVLLPVALAAAATMIAVPNTSVADVAYYVAASMLLCGAWLAALRWRPGTRRPAVLLALSLTATLAGNVTATVLERLAGEPPALSPADVLWLSAYPLLAVALWDLVRRRAPGQLRAGVLDTAVLTTAAAVAAWQVLILPNLTEGGLSIANVLSAAYPLGDVTVLAGVLVLVLSPGPRGPATRLLIGNAALCLVCDLLYSLLPGFTGDANISRVDGLMVVAETMLVAALLHRSAPELITAVPARPRTLHLARVLLLGAALLTAPTIAVLRIDGAAGTEALLLVATAVACGFVLARFTGAVREQERIQALLAHQASHDAVTGLANRASFTERLDLAPAGSPVVYIDLDGFKAVNDQAGHDAGDAILTVVAERLRSAVRAGDVVARLGGDEFALVCPGLSATGAEALAERLVRLVAEPVEYAGTLYGVGASIGVAIAGKADRAETLRAADAAMYRAKRLGRGRWIMADRAPAPIEPAQTGPAPTGPAPTGPAPIEPAPSAARS